jgi:hypothetical protein
MYDGFIMVVFKDYELLAINKFLMIHWDEFLEESGDVMNENDCEALAEKLAKHN